MCPMHAISFLFSFVFLFSIKSQTLKCLFILINNRGNKYLTSINTKCDTTLFSVKLKLYLGLIRDYEWPCPFLLLCKSSVPRKVHESHGDNLVLVSQRRKERYRKKGKENFMHPIHQILCYLLYNCHMATHTVLVRWECPKYTLPPLVQ